MATYTSNYAWTKPEGSDPVDITVLNNNLDSQDSIVHNAYMQLAPVFSTSATYAVDDVVLYANNLYKCITAVTVAGDWDSNKWTQVKVSDIAGGGGGGTSDYSQLTNKPSINSVTLSGNKTTADLHISYNDLENKPSIPSAQVNSDWNASSGVAQILNKPTLATVATSGSYADLTAKLGIQNASGTSMTQRNALQFKGGLSVSDDSTNERTVVSDEYELITWADWQTIVANHEEDLHPNAIITGAPDADGNISVDLMTKLWENPNPSAEMGATTLNVDVSDYDMFLVETPEGSAIGTKTNKAEIIHTGSYASTACAFRRTFTVNGTNIDVSAVLRYLLTNGAEGSATNGFIVPQRIYGIKSTASVKVSAIAESVSTSADKCMLSDGVTSVEDCVEDSGWIQIGTTGVYYRKIGKLITIKGTCVQATSGWTTLATLPEAMCPSINIQKALWIGSTSYQNLQIGTNGAISCYGSSASTFQESFLID